MNRLEMSKMNYEQQLEAVKQNGFALAYVQDQTPEICLAAVKQEVYALDFVNTELLRDDLEELNYDNPTSNLKKKH